MPTTEQVRKLLGEGMDYAAVGRELGIPAGQAYMIATGIPADGGDSVPEAEAGQRPYFLPSSQHLSSPPPHNPTSKESVRKWIAARVAADGQMRAAMRARTAGEEDEE
ncbi:MAG: hypothetical protein JO345_11490 [Streptosporangiaceae bacterium]|nr:hypothetical protein [Streptosporangiaceae bacterium]